MEHKQIRKRMIRGMKVIWLLASICFPFFFSAGCTTFEDIPESVATELPENFMLHQMSPEEFPLTQGSNPTKLVSERLFKAFTGVNVSETGFDKIRHTGTSEAYVDFLDQDSPYDMIIAQQPEPDTEKALEGTLFKPIAKDALVFITNKED